LIGKFLIDECLSVGLTATAKARGHQADHVAHLGKSGWQDWNLVAFALENDYIFVTNNRLDFLKHYAKVDVHSGLIIIIPNVKGQRAGRLA
jgi:predicted nuclease of predicted toxin-antitoxin system